MLELFLTLAALNPPFHARTISLREIVRESPPFSREGGRTGGRGPPLIKQARNRFLIRDAADRFGEKGGDRDFFDLGASVDLRRRLN